MQLSRSFQSPELANIKDGPVKDYLRSLEAALEDQHRKIHNDLRNQKFGNVQQGNYTEIESDGDIIQRGIGRFLESLKYKLTPIGGFAISLTNNTGLASVEGQVVEADDTDENSYKTADASAIDAIGTVYNAGIADGSETFIVVAGIAEVLIDAGGCVHHDRLIASATAGSADVSNTPAVGVHFQEIGHAIETVVGAGLAKAVLHFL